MGKRQKEDSPNINAVANKDIIQRLNFLYQASVYLQSLEGGNQQKGGSDLSLNAQPTQSVAEKSVKQYARKKRSNRRTNVLARDYIHCMRQVAQKTTVKMYGKSSIPRPKT